MKHSLLHIIIIIILSSLFVNCNKEKSEVSQENVIARAFDNYLYLSDISEILIDAKNKEDSFKIIDHYAKQWARKKILVKLAEKNLTNEDLDVQKELEDYRNNLIIYRYQQAYINKHLDTNITEIDIEKYYHEHKNELILTDNIVKAFLIQLPKSFQQLSKIKSELLKNKTNNTNYLDYVCNKFAYQCNDFNNQWIHLDKILSYMPTKTTISSDILKTQKFIETKDSNFIYLIKIENYKLIGDTMPKEWAFSQVIKPNLLISRKIKLLNDLDKKILEEYQKTNKIEFYYP